MESIDQTHLCQFYPSLGRLSKEVHGPSGEKDNWYIAVIAVRDESRGLGIGRAIMQYVEEQVRSLTKEANERLLITMIDRLSARGDL